MYIRNKISWLTIVGMSIIMNACSIDVPPPDLYSDPDAICDVKSARSLLTSCYLLYPHYEYEISTLGNDFCMTNLSGKDADQQNLYLWQDNKISDFASDCWLAYYNCIANCDILLDRLPNVQLKQSSESSELKAIEAEGKTLKAMAYFDVLRLFSSDYDNTNDTLGMIIKTQTGVEPAARKSKKESVKYIMNLLQEAEGIENNPSSNGWLSRNAAIYMLAEVCLYANEYERAARYAQTLIDDCRAEYISSANYARLWGTPSYEGRIFAFNTNLSFYSFIEFSDEGDYFALNPELAYSENDCRKEWSIYPKDVSGTSHNLIGKYNKVNKENGSIAYINRMRYAGAYFIAAEAYARLKMDSKAIGTLNTYLSAIEASTLDTSLKDNELVDKILQEKYKEFVGEGNNYFDLKRIQADALSRYAAWGISERSVIRKDDYRWTLPIPASEYKYNEDVVQNTGWPINR